MNLACLIRCLENCRFEVLGWKSKILLSDIFLVFTFEELLSDMKSLANLGQENNKRK